MMPGLLIAIEGGDAVGKRTQSEMLHAHLHAHWQNKVFPNHPIGTAPAAPGILAFPRYDTPLGKYILRHLKGHTALMEEHTRSSSDHNVDGDTYYRRAPEDAVAFQCMMTVDRYHVAPELLDALAHGSHIVLDRWWQSAFAFGAAAGLDGAWLYTISESLPQADVNILLDAPEGLVQARRPLARDRHEKDAALLARAHEAYRNLWHSEQLDRQKYVTRGQTPQWVIVDAMQSVEDVHAEIVAIVEANL